MNKIYINNHPTTARKVTSHPLSSEYSIVTSHITLLTDDQRASLRGTKRKILRDTGTTPLARPPLDSYQLQIALNHHGDCSYTQLPRWIQLQLIAGDWKFEAHDPTNEEMIETLFDAQEHRVLNNELTFNDYRAKYLGGKKFSLNKRVEQADKYLANIHESETKPVTHKGTE